MCYSLEASFTVGGALIPAGAYCTWQAVHKRPCLIGLALMPVGFGLQQICEGFVWLGLQREDPHLTQASALAYLFFALAFWPCWFPFFAALMEPQRHRRWLLAGITLLGTIWFWLLFFPLLLDPEKLLRVEIVHHSVSYKFPDLAIYRYIGLGPLRPLYLAALALPFVLSSERAGWMPGVMLGLSAIVCALVYSYAFVSVWCFFAAVMSAYICWIFHTLPARGSTAAAESPARWTWSVAR